MVGTFVHQPVNFFDDVVGNNTGNDLPLFPAILYLCHAAAVFRCWMSKLLQLPGKMSRRRYSRSSSDA